MSKSNDYSSFTDYRRIVLPKNEGKLPYDKPEEFGKALAERHLQRVRDAVQEWERESNKTKKQPTKSRSPKPPQAKTSKKG